MVTGRPGVTRVGFQAEPEVRTYQPLPGRRGSVAQAGVRRGSVADQGAGRRGSIAAGLSNR